MRSKRSRQGNMVRFLAPPDVPRLRRGRQGRGRLHRAGPPRQHSLPGLGEPRRLLLLGVAARVVRAKHGLPVRVHGGAAQVSAQLLGGHGGVLRAVASGGTRPPGQSQREGLSSARVLLGLLVSVLVAPVLVFPQGALFPLEPIDSRSETSRGTVPPCLRTLVTNA